MQIATIILFFTQLVAPVIITEVIDQMQNEGVTVFFICQATGEPVPTISWYFNGALVNNETNMDKYGISQSSLNTTTVNNTLTIMNVESSDVGTYTCNATNVLSSNTSSGVLTVNGELYVHLIMSFNINYFAYNSVPKHNYINRRTTIQCH